MPVSPDPFPRLQPFTMLVPVEHRVNAQQIADRRFISLSDLFREAIAEKLERERSARDEADCHAR
jgi:hypothetical protein